MAENHTDPSGNTEAFRAFANPETAAVEVASRTSLIVGAAVVAGMLLALATWLAFG
ncbi:hypothetical protein HCA58_00395 [Micromonospora sp. HNM0581]|uniref:hypothetical protein n=1 Tax=Micromonospora sp. HNM0581 TaxID=2716341 RepID=UPI001469A7BA|nr:hypothetical protein [Micromonospora sp. HNM0581]NLU76875.1 hypothetical protein [Micromonospora sp. HNM0581]